MGSLELLNHDPEGPGFSGQQGIDAARDQAQGLVQPGGDPIAGRLAVDFSNLPSRVQKDGSRQGREAHDAADLAPAEPRDEAVGVTVQGVGL